uniref:Uncharacterized protein n=1 Tax=Arion vulgaris TaxID=1028688 RepID=A0A0B7AAP4_9EUPU
MLLEYGRSKERQQRNEPKTANTKKLSREIHNGADQENEGEIGVDLEIPAVNNWEEMVKYRDEWRKMQSAPTNKLKKLRKLKKNKSQNRIP